MSEQRSNTNGNNWLKYGFRLALAMIIAVTLIVIVNLFIPEPPEGLSEQQFMQLSSEVQQNAASVAQDAMVVDERTEALEEARLAEITESEGEIARLEEELRKAQEDLATSQAELANSQASLEEAGETTNVTPSSPIDNILDDDDDSGSDDANSNSNATVTETTDGLYIYQFEFEGETYEVTATSEGIMVIGAFDLEVGGSGQRFYVGDDCEKGLLDVFPGAVTTGFTYNENNADLFEHHILKNDNDLSALTEWVEDEIGDFDGLVIMFVVEDNILEQMVDELSQLPKISIIVPLDGCPAWDTMELPEN